jgi:hypothetical protein
MFPHFVLDYAIVSASFLLAFVILTTARSRLRKNDGQLPPGPRGLPLLGNLKDLAPPGKPEFLHWLKHKDLYGPISSITVLGQTMVFIHDRNIALDLLEKRAVVHSGRPKMKFGFDMLENAFLFRD